MATDTMFSALLTPLPTLLCFSCYKVLFCLASYPPYPNGSLRPAPEGRCVTRYASWRLSNKFEGRLEGRWDNVMSRI